PGWPLILSLGVLIGAPSLMGPLLAAGWLIIFYLLARSHFSREEADLALAVAFCNPFVVFNGASFFSHMPCLFLVTLSIYFAFNILRDPSARGSYFGLGCSAGFSFLVRPYTTVVTLLPVGLFLAYHLFKRVSVGNLVSRLSLGVVPLMTCLGAYFL